MDLITYPVDEIAVKTMLENRLNSSNMNGLDTLKRVKNSERQQFTDRVSTLLNSLIDLKGFFGELFFAYSSLVSNKHSISVFGYPDCLDSEILSLGNYPTFVNFIPLNDFLVEDFDTAHYSTLILHIAVCAIPTIEAIRWNSKRLNSGLKAFGYENYISDLEFCIQKQKLLGEFVKVSLEQINFFQVPPSYINLNS
ncbi:MAG: hypothetical protein ACRCXZ_07980 [Patescibacteria group bacterium]